MRATDHTTRVLLAVSLAVAIACVYGRALAGPFVFDDLGAIVENESVHSLTLRALFVQPLDLALSGRPFAVLTVMLNHSLGGLDPRGYRAVNFALHWATALLLCGVVRRTLGSPRLRSQFGARATELAAVTAFLFALHPLASETVCYISARTESVMAVCYLATLYLA